MGQIENRRKIGRVTDICTAMEYLLRPEGPDHTFTASQIIEEIRKPEHGFKFNGYENGRPFTMDDIGRAIRALDICKIIERIPPFEGEDLTHFKYKTGRFRLLKRWHDR